MKRRYNQRQDLRAGKRTFNPDFWEVAVEYRVLCRYSEEQGLWYEAPWEAELRHRAVRRIAEAMSTVRGLVERALTERQREVVQLYFYEKKTQHEVAELLGISVASVSQHLFGKRRGDRVVGGAIPKLRRELRRSGWPERALCG